MTIAFSNEAEKVLLDVMLPDPTDYSWTCRLFKGDITPAAGDTASTYTAAGVEANFSGYSGQSMSMNGYWPAASSVNGKAESQFSASIPFVRDSSSPGTNNTIYGFFVTDNNNKLIMAERFPNGPYAMNNNGDTLNVRPTLRLYDAGT